MKSSIALIITLLSLTTSTYANEAAKRNLKVIELFTSQGCSSCPRADRFLKELSTREDTITIACHVTYWNYLGWKDIYSLPFCDNRQRDYKRSLQKHTAYTPQMVINGRYEGIGSQRGSINKLLDKADNNHAIGAITLSKNNQQLTMQTSGLVLDGNAHLHILGLGSSDIVEIKNGENGGRNLEYHNPVHSHHTIKLMPQNTLNIQQEIEDNNIPIWVAILQDINNGEIIAAGRLDI